MVTAATSMEAFAATGAFAGLVAVPHYDGEDDPDDQIFHSVSFWDSGWALGVLGRRVTVHGVSSKHGNTANA
jgi:hypothetical protein